MAMVATLGEALAYGWRIHARRAFGKHDGMKSIRECIWRLNLDVPTLVATRGRDFPVGRLASMLRCLDCGSREIAVYF